MDLRTLSATISHRHRFRPCQCCYRYCLGLCTSTNCSWQCVALCLRFSKLARSIRRNYPSQLARGKYGKIFAAYDVLYNSAYISGGVIGIAATSTFSYRAVLTTACVTYFAASMFFAKLNDGKVSKVSVVAAHPSGHRSMMPTPERQFAN